MFGLGKDPDSDDLLILIRADGNILKDTGVRQELGLLHSDKYGMAMSRVEQVPVLHWPRVNDVPVKKGAAFVYADDPPMPQDVSRIMNHILPEAYRAALSGNSYRQRKAKRRGNYMKMAAAFVVVAAFFVTFVMSELPWFQDDPPLTAALHIESIPGDTPAMER